MKKKYPFIFILLLYTSFLYSQTYEPVEMKSGGLLGKNNLRFLLNWSHIEYASSDASVFDFGMDFGIGEKLELQNRIGYQSSGGSNYDWQDWTELLKFKLVKSYRGPAYALGTGIKIPLHKYESLGLIAGLYISSAIKDIDFDFNLGLNPFYITYHEYDSNTKIRPNSIFDLDFRLGYKFTRFFKLTGGFKLNQKFNGKKKITNPKTNEVTYTELSDGSAWTMIFGGRVKPAGYPLIFDGTIFIGLSNAKDYDWKIKLGIQFQPQSPNAEW